jgi:hypothetical protein
MSDDHTRNLFGWLSQVARDDGLPPTAARLAIILSSYVNRESGDAWPAVPTLARNLGVVENSVRKALRAMVAAGHLEIDAGGGRAATHRYRPVLKDALPAEKPCTPVKGNVPKPCTDVKRKDGKHFTDVKRNEEKPCTDVKALPVETLHGRAQNPSRACAKPFTGVKANHLKEPSEEPSDGESLFPEHEPQLRRATRSSSESQDKLRAYFAKFWATYPRPVGKPYAWKAFAQAVRAGASPAEIIDGAARFAAERAAQEPDPAQRERFTPYPANWLNRKGWTDPPPPTPSSNRNTRGDAENFTLRVAAAEHAKGARGLLSDPAYDDAARILDE